jgi:hypothetical protein
MAVGRISGPLLKANLLRQGVDLAFETDLLYLDVNNLRLGVNTNTPTHDLQVNGTTRTTELEATTSAQIGEISIANSTISTTNNQLSLIPAGNEAVVYQKKLIIDSIDIENNTISVNSLNTDLLLEASGTGKIVMQSDLLVQGNIHATGNISADGSIILGDQDTDNVVFNADVNSNINPNQSDLYNLGTPDKRWNNLTVKNIFSDTIDIVENLVLDGVNLDTRPGNTFYVGANGSDTATGTHQNDPFLTIKYALSQATSGSTVIIYPGIYNEIFPLTVPANVSVKGSGIRSVTIQPTPATIENDAFLLNGETTLEEFTVKGFRFNGTNNTGYAFKYATGMTVNSRSPYIRNITVITEGSVTGPSDPRGFLAGDAGKGAYLDGSVVNVNSKEASCLFHSVTFICPGVDAITAINGVRIEWLNCFTYFSNRGLLGLSGTAGFASQGKTLVKLFDVVGSGSIQPGDSMTYYDIDGTTILATGIVSSIELDGANARVLLNGKSAGFVAAEERNGKTITANGNAKLSTALKKFGTASLSLDGTGDYAFIQSNTDFEFGTQDFTIEGWFYRIGTDRTQVIYDQRTATPQVVPLIFINSSNQLIYNVNGNARITGSVVSANSWNHFAVSRSGTSTRLFLNGTQVGTTYTDTNNYIQGPVTIGISFNLGVAFEGYIDDLRVSKGVARYTANFTPPLATVANDNYTVLLSRFDGLDQSTEFIDESILIQDIRFSSGATSEKIELVDYSDFGVEIRSIGSAHVYGNFGAAGDGLGVIMYLIGQNMAYIGTGLRSDNDVTYVVQANEVVENNGAKVYYSSVDHKGDFRVGDLFYVNQEDGTVTFTTATFNVQSDQGLIFTNGSNITYIDGNKIETGNLRLSGNTLESITGDVNISSASGNINLLDDVTVQGDLNVTGNVTIGGNITIGDETTDDITFVGAIASDLIPNADNTYDIGSSSPLLKWKDVYLSELSAGDIQIQSNQITSSIADQDVEFVSNGIGTINIEDYVFKDNEIRSLVNADIIIQPDGTGIVQINSTTSLRIPVGLESERPVVPTAGMIRFNTTINRFEGYDGTVWKLLDGLSDIDRDTYITPELTPGANDNTIRFYAAGTKVAEITQQKVDVLKLTVDDIEISGNSITNTAGNNLQLQSNGSISINGLSFSGTTISNPINNGNITFSVSGSGYFNIPGSGGVVIPSGSSSFRPPNAVVGMIRFDTLNNRVEVYDGTIWISSAGSSVGITRGEAEEIALGIALIFG